MQTSGPAPTAVLLIDDLHVRVVNEATGELIRDLEIDPSRDYQPTGAPRGPAGAPPIPELRVREFPMS
jgi:hypothetical protein